MQPYPFQSSCEEDSESSHRSTKIREMSNRRAYAIEFWTKLANKEGSSRGTLARLAMGIAIPRVVKGWASGTTAVKKGMIVRT